MKVNSLGKWKTALQMVAMSAMLAVRRADFWLGESEQGNNPQLYSLDLPNLLLCWDGCASLVPASKIISPGHVRLALNLVVGLLAAWEA